VIPRRHKLTAAGAVLAVGVAASWPLRRTEPLLPGNFSPVQTCNDQDHNPSAAQSPPAPLHTVRAVSSFVAAAPTVHESNAAAPLKMVDSSRLPRAAAVEEPSERIHVVHQGDSLDRLAKRYLGDEGRALEIFEINRKVLENPHILPLGVELQIPAEEHSATASAASDGRAAPK
jgi:nucleoid-associated protein YgaU